MTPVPVIRDSWRKRPLSDPQADLTRGHNEQRHLADLGLTHCNIVLQRSESAQKTANGRTRPDPAVRATAIPMSAVSHIADKFPML